MRRWLPLLTVCLGTFVLLVDVTIVNVALPAMAVDLDTTFGALQWVIDAYALALAALLLGAGSLADRVGHRRAYVAGLTLFALSSLGCGLAPDASSLVLARAVQGVGAAAMFATTFALLNSAYAGADRGAAYGIWGAVAGASAAIGPILGGLLTQGVSWRWIFFVNLPVSVAAIALCVFVLRDAHERVPRRVDVPGIVTFTATAAAATYGLIRANEEGWSDSTVWMLLGASALLLTTFALIEARVREPMLELALLRRRAFVGVLLGGGLSTFAAFAAFIYTSIWLQSVLGLSPIAAGLTGLPMPALSFVTSATLGRRLHGRRPDRIIGGGLLLIGAGDLLGAALVHGSAGWPALVPGFAVIGIGVGLVTPSLGSTTMSLVPAQRGGMAAGAGNTTRQLGFAFGIAVLGSVFVARAQAALSDHGVAHATSAARALAGGQAPSLIRGGASEAALHASAAAGVQAVFLVAGAVGLVAGALVLALMRPGRSGVAAPSRAADLAAG